MRLAASHPMKMRTWNKFTRNFLSIAESRLAMNRRATEQRPIHGALCPFQPVLPKARRPEARKAWRPAQLCSPDTS